FLIESEEFENNGIPDHVFGLFNSVPFLCESRDPFFIPAECEPFVDPGVELPSELGKRPLVLPGFYFIKPALVPVVNIQEKKIMRPAESKPGYALGRPRLPDLSFRQCFGRRFRRQCLRNLRSGFLIFEV